MRTVPQTFVGVDVSKNFLDIHFHPTGKQMHVENSKDGIDRLLNQLKRYAVNQVVCEASGGYEERMLRSVARKGFKTWLVEPNRIRSFARAEGVRTKTDEMDAKIIAQFASKHQSLYEKRELTDEEMHLKHIVARRDELKEMIKSEKQRLKSPGENPYKDSIKKHILFMKQNVKMLEEEANKITKNNSEFQEKTEILTSVPGVGEQTARTLIAYLPELGTISNKKIAALVGVAPFTRQSGNFRGRECIAGGRPVPRNALFMVALVASKRNRPMRLFYERLLARGKKPKVALTAIMRRILVILNAMVAKNERWNERKALPQN